MDAMTHHLRQPPAPQEDWAYFLDFDGTLVAIAERPDAVEVGRELKDLLGELERRSEGRVVIVSGRSIKELDTFLDPLKPRAAGLHGLEYRFQSGGAIQRQKDSDEALNGIRQLLADFAARHDGVQLEDKDLSLALHFRRAPHCAAEVRDIAAKALKRLGEDYVLLAGKMVCEIKPRNVDKGQVIGRFSELGAFSGRRPVFVGDDVTDEAGFAACNALGGVSVRVGRPEEATEARFLLADVEAVEAWLGRIGANGRG